jgi:hypothetical protein
MSYMDKKTVCENLVSWFMVYIHRYIIVFNNNMQKVFYI